MDAQESGRRLAAAPRHFTKGSCNLVLRKRSLSLGFSFHILREGTGKQIIFFPFRRTMSKKVTRVELHLGLMKPEKGIGTPVFSPGR